MRLRAERGGRSGARVLVVRRRRLRSGCSRVARGRGRLGRRRRRVRRACGRGKGRSSDRGGSGKGSGRQLELVERAVADCGREGEERVGGGRGGGSRSLPTSWAQERLARDRRGRSAEQEVHIMSNLILVCWTRLVGFVYSY